MSCGTCGRVHPINHDHLWHGDELGHGDTPVGRFTYAAPGALLDLAGLTDDQLRQLRLAILGLLSGGPDRTAALKEVRRLRAEQTATEP